MQGTAFSNQEQHQCQQCMQFIQDRYYLQVMDKTWHLNCLRCVDCKLSLDSQQTCFAKDGLIYCKDDYYKRFPRKCNNCFQAINPNEFVMRARQFIFHLNCFKCMVCERQLNTGEEYGINCKDGSIYCRVHYCPIGDNEPGFDYMSNLPPTPGISPASHNSSTPLFNLNLNSVPAGDESQGTQKARAKKRKIITDSTNKKSSVQRKNPSKNSPSNKDDADIAESPDQFQSNTANLDYYSDNEDDYLDTSTSNAVSQNSAANGTNYYDSVAAVAAAAAAAAAAQRQKRMRTSFKHHQLRVMKSYFELNHNPDAKDLKQLSQKTGLSKRVLQVWFQNARAKFRRGQSNPCGADPVGELTAMNASNTGVSSSSTSSISSSSSTSNQQHMTQHMDAIDQEDSSSHSLSLENLDKQLGQSSDISSYTLLENTSNYNQNYMFNSSSALHLPPHHNSNYTNLNHQLISHHNLQSNAAPGATQVTDFNSNSLCVDNLII